MNQPPYGQQAPYGQQQQAYPQAAPVPPQKKGMSGCLLAFLIVLGLFVVGGAIGGFILYRTFAQPFTEMMAIVKDGTTAPGTDELRSAGCKTASAMDAAKLMKVVKEFGEKFGADPSKMGKEPEAPTLVFCELKPAATLTCDDVAHTYTSAANPKDKFAVAIRKSHSKTNECSVLYDASGKKLGEATGASSVPITTEDDKE